MSAPDFEIKANMRAKRLVAHIPPNAQTRAEGEVTLARHEQRSGAEETMEAGEPYLDVVIDKRIIGEMQHGQATGDATGRDEVAWEASDAGGQQHRQGRRRSNSRKRERSTKLGSSRQTKGSTKLGLSKGPTPVTDARESGRVTRSSKRKRASAEQAASIPARKRSSPRSPKRGGASASSSAGDGLAEAVRNMNEAAAILRDVRQRRRQD